MESNKTIVTKPHIGIIGGAGPMAGALLFQKIIEISQKEYFCEQDADFPHIHLINYPFSDMLTTEKNETALKQELQICFSYFKNTGVSIAAIACNTLHSFLPPLPKGIQLVHMIKETAIFLQEKQWENPLILCSHTAAKSRLHAHYFPCRYPKASVQEAIDIAIGKITMGDYSDDHGTIIDSLQEEGPIILGCTELSLLHDKRPLRLKNFCDPNLIVAKKLCSLVL